MIRNACADLLQWLLGHLVDFLEGRHERNARRPFSAE